MAKPIFGICDPKRLATRFIRSARPLFALMAAMLPVAALAHGCGNAADSTGDPSDFQITIELPPDVEARLLDLAAELGAAVCERGRNCCDDYGLAARTDCLQLGGELFLLRLVEATDLGAKDPSELDFYIDDVMAEHCVQVARSVSNKCAFTDESLFDWVDPCSDALVISPKGETPDECSSNRTCVTKYGPGHGCVVDSCRPIVEVEQGAPCGRANEGATIPVCGAGHHCTFGTCEPNVSLGEPCRSSDECVPEAYCDDAENTEHTCATRLPVGAPCEFDEDCTVDMRCACATSGCEERHCFEARDVGEPCSVNAECPFGTLCKDGICHSQSIGFCKPP
ncbi:hypothetical protein WME95_38180 [Sorangium sp. So ce327]|uniref:hypothetical protein n=1 Tax=Sorangium sp. So ce327 TaxID=3133301 RepID=UPI003F5DA1C2